MRKSAENAISDPDFKEFKKRKVAIDWAKSKDTYVNLLLEGNLQFTFFKLFLGKESKPEMKVLKDLEEKIKSIG